MTEINLLSTISLIGIIGSGICFWVYAKKKEILNPSLNQYLLADKQIDNKDFAGSFVASTVSLGGNIMFFIACHRIYGWLMIIGPIFYIIAHIIFLLVLKQINAREINYKTFPELWLAVFPCKITARCIAIISVVACLLFFFIEVHVGSAILYILFPQYDILKHLAFFFIGLTILAYAYHGGYLAVVKTDRWQLILMIGASVALWILAVYIPTNDGYGQNMIKRLFSYDEPSNLMTGIFLVWAIIINICGCFYEPTILQRIHASKNIKEALLGTFKSIWGFIFVLLIPILSFTLIYVKGYYYDTLEEFLSLIANHGGGIKFILYPTIIVGFAAALFSTADTSAIAVIYSICDQATFANMLQKNHAEQKFFRRLIVLSFVVIVLLMTILHYAIASKLGALIVPVMYIIWGTLSIVSPLTMYALYRLANGLPAMQANQRQKINLLIFGLLSIGTIFYGTIKAIDTNLQVYSQLSLLVALAVMSIGVWVTIRLEKQVNLECTAAIPVQTIN